MTPDMSETTEIPAELRNPKVKRALLILAADPAKPAHENAERPLATLWPLYRSGLVEKRPYLAVWGGIYHHCNEVWLTEKGKAIAASIRAQEHST